MDACISLDGTRIAAIFNDKTVCIYDTTSGELIRPPFKVDEIPWTVILSRDGKLVASGGSNALRLWNVETGEEGESFDINVHSLAFSPDSTCIAAGCEGSFSEGIIRVINLVLAKMSAHVIPSGGGGTLLKGEVRPSPFEGHNGPVYSVAFSPDGSQIASSSNDSTVRVWDVSTGSRRTFWTSSYSINSLTFSPDGTQVAANIGLFNLSTGSFTPHAFDIEVVSSFSFSGDGRLIVSGSSGKACYIWDASIRQSILRLVGHTDDVRFVAFFPDGKEIMSASKDGTIRVWDVEEREEMDGWRMEWDDSDDGLYRYWVLGPKKERLFWTPLPFRHTRNTLVIGRCLDIDFSNLVHGDEWVKCREPLESKVSMLIGDNE